MIFEKLLSAKESLYGKTSVQDRPVLSETSCNPLNVLFSIMFLAMI